jgi:DNA-binding transcriptional LysR family regulator
MQLSFNQLKSMVVFAQVVRHGSLANAARHIGISRAVVSYHVKRLEKQLAVKLLNRSTRSMSLTDAGKQYYESCKLIAEEAETANQRIENLRDEPVGTLRMTCSVNLGLRTIVPLMT